MWIMDYNNTLGKQVKLDLSSRRRNGILHANKGIADNV